MQYRERLNTWLFRAAGVLACLAMLSFWGASRLYARYTTGFSGSDGARVARFSFSAASDQLTQQEDYAVRLTPQQTEKITVRLENDSETAVRCRITFHETGNAPLRFTPDASGGLTAEGANSWYLDIQPGEEAPEDLTFTVELADSSYAYAGSVAQVSLTVLAEQLD